MDMCRCMFLHTCTIMVWSDVQFILRTDICNYAHTHKQTQSTLICKYTDADIHIMHTCMLTYVSITHIYINTCLNRNTHCIYARVHACAYTFHLRIHINMCIHKQSSTNPALRDNSNEPNQGRYETAAYKK